MVQLVLSVPLKTAAQLFTLFKILVFPMRLSPDTLKYRLDYHCFGLAAHQCEYTLDGSGFAAVHHKRRHRLPRKGYVVPHTSSNMRREFIIPELR
jgi:hypothetical protein